MSFWFVSQYCLIAVLIALTISTSCSDDADSTSEKQPQEKTGEDDTSDDVTDDASDEIIGDLPADACPPPMVFPEPYRTREAAWFVARLEGEDLPMIGLYAYFWIDRYSYKGCSYSSNWVVWFKAGGGIEENDISGEYRSGADIVIGDNAVYDIDYPPRMHLSADEADPYNWVLDLETETIAGHLPLRLNHVRSWSAQWFAAYDAVLQNAEITVGGQSYSVEGTIDFERWYDIGGAEPASEEDDFIEGAWLYDVLSWSDESGARLQTLTLFWIKTDGTNAWVHQATGVLSSGDEEREIVYLESNLDFPENETSGGYPMRHAMSGTIEGGTEFSYDVSVIKEYKDEASPLWADIVPSGHRESHSLVSGTLVIGGRTFTGGGVYEWRVTDYNPLATTE